MPSTPPPPPPTTAQPLSVSDVHDAPGPQIIGGRLLVTDRTALADAYRIMPLSWASPPRPAVAHGTLLTIRGHVHAGAIRHAEIIDRRPTPTIAHGHWRRFHAGGAQRLTLRAAIIASLRRFMERRAYLEVETPLLVVSPGLDVHLDAFAVAGTGAHPTRYLSTSPEYHMKRLLSAGVPRLFQLARCFRRGESGRRHNPEFTMLEWYTAYANVEQMMAQTEQLVRAVFQEHHPRQGDAVAGVCDVRQPFARVSMREAFERFAGIDNDAMLHLAQHHEERFFRLLIERIEPALARLGVAVFLYDYPACQASLARLAPQRPTVAERFELYLGDWELCNGFGELTCANEQRARLLADQRRREQQGKPVYPIDERFLAALEQGMPPAAGNALGVDRLVALCLDRDDIDEVMAFSHSRR